MVTQCKLEMMILDAGSGDGVVVCLFFFSSRRRHTRFDCDWSSDVCSSDLQRAAGRADVAIMNNGGIRADLPEGVITWGNVYQVQPFQNRLQRLTVTGAVLLDALEHCVAGRDHFPDCHVAGVQVWYDAGTAPGKRISRTRLENGKSIDKDRTYTLVVSDFMTTGGSGFRMLAAAPQEDLDVVGIDPFIPHLGALPAPLGAPARRGFHPA